MNEKYLHLIWKQQRFLTSHLELTDGRTIHINHPGEYNKNLSGPDFELGKVIIDSMEWCGPIELHVNSSDWYKHNHHTDDAYKNVILHVVYTDDQPVVINNYKVPTLELKTHISLDHFWKFSGVNPSGREIICSRSIEKVDKEIKRIAIENALFQKLHEKRKALDTGNKSETFYRLLGASFGMGINKKPFEELTRAISWSQLKTLNPAQRFHLLFAASGLLSDQRKEVFSGGFKWNFKGTRPSNFPSKRLAQFAALISQLDIEFLIEQGSIETLDKEFVHVLSKSDGPNEASLFTNSFINHLRINTIAPYCWSFECWNEDDVLEYLKKLDPESNAIIRRWEKLNIQVTNAFDSQGVIALYRYNCCEKKCLSCAIGKTFLNIS